MNQESVFTDLPSEIIINILSRLPILPIITCKLVCKPWLQLLQTREFAKSHLAKSTPGLVVYAQSYRDTSLFKVFEFKDEPDLELHELHYDLVAKINHDTFISPSHQSIAIQGSAEGLLFLRAINTQPHVHYICNPITRECIELPGPDGIIHSYPTIKTYGFGVSKTTRQHKVVRILHECVRDKDSHALIDIPNSECHVYTLGTGTWRKIAHSLKMEYSCRSIGAFLNGSLHWLVVDLKGSFWISCFDLETECFSTFSPVKGLPERRRSLGDLFVLGERLCLCDNTSESEIVIWLMKEYGVEKSWSKEYVISKSPDIAGEYYEVVRPMKVFGDGDILMAWQDFYLFYYSDKTKTAEFLDLLRLNGGGRIDSMIHKSSFFSLKVFDKECVRSF